MMAVNLLSFCHVMYRCFGVWPTCLGIKTVDNGNIIIIMHPNLKEGKGNNNNKALFAIFYIFYMQVHFMLNRNVFWH